MRVLLVETVSELGGAQWSLFELASQLARDGVDVLAAVPKGPLYATLKGAGVAVAEIPSFRARRKPLSLLFRSIASAGAAARIRKTAWLFNPDIVHANSITAGLLALPLAHSRALVCHVRDLRFPIRPMLQLARQARRIVATSEAVDSYLSEFLHGSQRSRLVRVENGIDLDRFSPCDPDQACMCCGLARTAPVVGMVAHLTPWKRHDVFIEMAALIAKRRPDVRFAIVGQDLFGENKAYRDSLRQLAADLGVEASLQWFEHIYDARDILQTLDILVHPPHDEPFGRVLCEAMAMRKPVVAVRQNGPSEIVEHQVTGLLVGKPEAALLAEAALDLLDNPEKAAAYGNAGRERVAARFNVTRAVRQVRAIYESAAAEVAKERAARNEKT